MKFKGQFFRLPRALLESPALDVIGNEGWQVLRRIMIEDLRHAGKDNGHLIVTYGNLLKCGLHNRASAKGFRQLEAVGIVELIRGRAGTGNTNAPTKIRLTFLPAYGKPATDEWRNIKTVEDAKAQVMKANKSRGQSAWLRAHHSPRMDAAPHPTGGRTPQPTGGCGEAVLGGFHRSPRVEGLSREGLTTPSRGVGGNGGGKPGNEARTRVLAALAESGGMPFGKLALAAGLGWRQANALLDAMRKAGEVTYNAPTQLYALPTATLQ